MPESKESTPAQQQAQFIALFAGGTNDFIRKETALTTLVEQADITRSLKENICNAFRVHTLSQQPLNTDIFPSYLYFLVDPEGIFGNLQTRIKLEKSGYYELVKSEGESDQKDDEAEKILRRNRDKFAHFRSDIWASEFLRVYKTSILPQPGE